ncbi:MAG TPA: valine--tRNA ligase [Acidimicrobiia bacterium]|nr:valine--tRNA ligase [Acidimicrobiia bacterium]
MRTVPDKPALEGIEAKWMERWESEGTYRFDRSRSREEIFAIDTPPPTVSGSLHMGSVFGYVQTDAIARYQRMKGMEVFYPMGWDDNGLPTERRVQNYYGVRCDPTLHYDPGFTPPEEAPEPPMSVSRRNFIELCHGLTAEDEKVFENLWRTLGLSVDWAQSYATIDEHCQRTSQKAFLGNLERGEAYSQEAPVLWDVDFKSAVAQAELEDRERPGSYHRIAFHRSDGEPVYIETTRPELICACVALVAHPDDVRYQPLLGSTVTSPLFGVDLPVMAHELADPEKGSGIAMICTWGDTTDVTWWREFDLPTRAVLQQSGRLQEDTPEWIDSETGRVAYEQIAGLYPGQAQRKMAEMLAESGDLDGEPRPITHPVKFFEKGDRPLEIISSRQWYIRNGGRDEDLRQALLARGVELDWIPDFMGVRYKHWVEGLNGDWLISRQRFFGVSVPVWYPIDAGGELDFEHPILPDQAELPVDPTTDAPPGYEESRRGIPGGFAGDPDVMDTWATSSLTPQIAGHWDDDTDLFARVFPMDLRPQGPEIIRTWLFSTLLRSHYEHGVLPWAHASINGWILDADRKKMSKSRGNVVTPIPLIEEHGAEAIRYWACNGRPGTDTAVDFGVMKIGRRLALKILNAARFVLRFADDVDPAAITEPLDRSMLASLSEVVAESTAAFEKYDYTRAIETVEKSFWTWTDDYLELVKARAYDGGAAGASAHAALQLALGTYLRLFAPFLPFVTEEVWSWWQEGSVHRAPWPSVAELETHAGDPAVFAVTSEVLTAVRRAKSDARASMAAEVASVAVVAGSESLALIRQAEADLKAAARAAEMSYSEGEFSIESVLAEA